jgi:hypothetical protein
MYLLIAVVRISSGTTVEESMLPDELPWCYILATRQHGCQYGTRANEQVTRRNCAKLLQASSPARPEHGFYPVKLLRNLVAASFFGPVKCGIGGGDEHRAVLSCGQG